MRQDVSEAAKPAALPVAVQCSHHLQIGNHPCLNPGLEPEPRLNSNGDG